MVRPGGRRGDDDLGPVMDWTGQVEGRTVIASSRGLKGRHSTFDILSTPTPFASGMYYDTGARVPLLNHHIYRLALVLLSYHTAHTLWCHMIYIYIYMDLHIYHLSPHPHYMIPISMVQEPMNEFSGPGRKLGAEFQDQMVGAVPTDSSYNTHECTAIDYSVCSSDPFVRKDFGDIGTEGSRNKRPDKTRDVSTQTQRKKAKSCDWELTGPADGGPIDPKLIPSYGGHVSGRIWLGQERSMLKSRSRYIMIAVIQSDLGIMYSGGGINGQELFDVATDPHGRLSFSDRAACYIQYFLGNSLFNDKSGNVIPTKLWPLVKNV
ncbi:hypothetical protein M9H77_31352 [Catharanthus roseus]|uniref:Uncharacterized protein n=1 Tax=Catharanthus roseus TaxID=4058 RepID=A0ACC0A0W4_CATRO|nr:hypothetical protein M9H77_31352 [Catharanthus roseus]